MPGCEYVVMSQNPDSKSVDTNKEIEREIRTNRKFSLSEAIGRIAGGDFMKGGSPVSRQRQAELEIEEYLRHHLADSGGVLRSVLLRHLGESLLNADYDRPLAALAQYISRVLASTQLLEEIVREADAEWGRVYDERPFKSQVARLTLTIHTQSIRFASHCFISTRGSRRTRVDIPASSDHPGSHVLTVSVLVCCSKARAFLLS
jgi:hypothetical protein